MILIDSNSKIFTIALQARNMSNRRWSEPGERNRRLVPSLFSSPARAEPNQGKMQTKNAETVAVETFL